MLVTDFAIIFGVAAFTIFLTSKFKLPSLLGYLLAGLIVGPYVPIPLFADTERLEQLSELGVILVMFSIGLEFRIKRFLKILPASGLRGLIQITSLLVIGTSLGYFFQWPINQSLLLGVSLAISSSMIVNKIYEDVEMPTNVRELVYGTLIIQDIFAIVIITIVTSIGLGRPLAVSELMALMGKLTIFVAFTFSIGRFVVPKIVNYALKEKSSEIVTIVACGICFSFALFAEFIGYSVALGAFIAGILVAESGRGNVIEHHTSQLKSIFSAMFFISVGMTIDPVSSIHSIDKSLIITLVIIIAQILSNLLAGILSGYGIQTSLISGLSLAQIGEFSFIIASIGKKFNLVTAEFYSIIVTVALMTTIIAPIIIKKRMIIHRWVEWLLPKRIQALIVVYLSWYNNDETRLQRTHIPIKNSIIRITVSVVIMITVSTALSVISPSIVDLIHKLNFTEYTAEKIYLVLELSILFPFILYAFFCAYNLTHVISKDIWAIKNRQSQVYMVIISAIRMVIFFVISTIVLFIVSPFVASSAYFMIILLSAPVLLFLFFWKKTEKLQEQMGDALTRFMQMQGTGLDKTPLLPIEIPRNIIPGLEKLKLIRIEEDSIVAGEKISTIDLKAKTGATIFAIIRNEQSITLPGGNMLLMCGDHIAIAGGDISVLEATELLTKKKAG